MYRAKMQHDQPRYTKEQHDREDRIINQMRFEGCSLFLMICIIRGGDSIERHS